MAQLRVDINSDMGESFGRYVLGNDDELLKCVTTANVACGLHAGDFMVMAATAGHAIRNGVAIGAHPGYPDLQGFGRRSLKMGFDEVRNLILYQIGALDAIVRSQGGRLSHVKLHGALGNDCSGEALRGNYMLTEALGQAVLEYDKSLAVMAFAATKMVERLRSMGVKVVEEIFADRAYNRDGTLVARSLPGAVLTSREIVLERAVRMIKERTVRTIDNALIEGINPDTICVHGDTKGAAELAGSLRQALEKEGISVKSFNAA